MLIASGIECMWPGTNASIPAGWTRTTNMDSRYPKGTAAAVNPDVTGGAATHTHTDSGHTHTETAHTHTGTTGSATGWQGTGVARTFALSHTHTVGASGSNSATSSSTAGVWQSGSNDPAYYHVIFISSDGTPTGFPNGCWAFWDNAASLPTSWSNPAAARDVFPKGAVAAGDGGGTGGGAHSHTANSHTHDWGQHTHTGPTSDSTTPSSGQSGGIDFTGSSSVAHTHTTSIAAGAALDGGTTSGSSGSTSYEPTWAKLAIVQNDSGVQNIQVRHVAVWSGLLSAIPTNWALCDGTNSTVDMRGRFVKGANGISEIGNTGGTAGHLHSSAATHTHAYDHTHQYDITGAASANGTLRDVDNDTANFGLSVNHSHYASTTSSATGTSGTGIQTSPSNADTQPAFRTRAFIALLTLPAGIQQSLIII